MLANHPNKHLQIKKGRLWELWLISPSKETFLGEFNTLEELNQAQITLYHCWEDARYRHEPHLAALEH
jgi:hypothetical protein